VIGRREFVRRQLQERSRRRRRARRRRQGSRHGLLPRGWRHQQEGLLPIPDFLLLHPFEFGIVLARHAGVEASQIPRRRMPVAIGVNIATMIIFTPAGFEVGIVIPPNDPGEPLLVFLFGEDLPPPASGSCRCSVLHCHGAVSGSIPWLLFCVLWLCGGKTNGCNEKGETVLSPLTFS